MLLIVTSAAKLLLLLFAMPLLHRNCTAALFRISAFLCKVYAEYEYTVQHGLLVSVGSSVLITASALCASWFSAQLAG